MKQKKNKILVVSNMYPSKKYPHYGIFVQHSAEILKKAGYDVDVVFIKKTNCIIKKIIAYVAFYSKTIMKGLFGQYSAIYAHYASHTALPLLILNKIKPNQIIMNVHGNDIIPETENDKKYLKLVKRVLDISCFIICPSEYFKEICINDYGIEKKNIGVYPSGGVDTDLFKPFSTEMIEDKLGLNKSYRYIGYVSRIEEKKGWDIFLLACARVINKFKDVKLIVVGDGSQIDQYIELVKKLKLEKNILKYNLLPQSDIVNIYNKLDVFIFSTYRKSESLGLVGLEAMACETLTVLPNKYGPASYGIDRENSIVFKAGDEKSLEHAIIWGLTHKVSNIKKNARITAVKFNHKNTDEILLDYFNKLMT